MCALQDFFIIKRVKLSYRCYERMMKMDMVKKPLENVISIIPASVRMYVINAVRDISHKVQEIVLRCEKPVCIYLFGEQYVLTKRGTLSKDIGVSDAVISSGVDVAECFNNVCGYSVYSHLSEIKEGFITLKGGHRVAISGTAVVSGDEIINIRDISTVSIRIAREVKGAGEMLADRLHNFQGGYLVCGAPVSGKTTLLRDVARIISTKYGKRTSVVDTRGELAAVSRGVAQNDIGLCDVLNGYPRYDGILQALRCLSPEYIFCDEIGTNEDADAILKGVNCGVKFVATVHANNEKELLSKSYFMDILSTGAFSKILFLKGREEPCSVKKELSIEELYNG